jgi:hypothetical protein
MHPLVRERLPSCNPGGNLQSLQYQVVDVAVFISHNASNFVSCLLVVAGRPEPFILLGIASLGT